MGVKLTFDSAKNPELPTMLLAQKSGNIICQLIPDRLVLSDKFNAPSEIYFNTYKSSYLLEKWNQINNFKLLWCKEWNKWYEIKVDIDERNYTEKRITCVQLGQAELSQIRLNSIEINTENDIARDDYKEPTVFWNPDNPKASLLHRLMKDKAKHYRVIHVDHTLAKIQRTFTFDNISIYDAFQQISEEIGCIFKFNSDSDLNGVIQRTISVYDLEYNCFDCNYRGEKFDVCPKCGSNHVIEPYGEDTGILISTDELTDSIRLTTDTPSIKNCFKLEAGDELMNATIRNINPNGSDYIWYISEELRKEMSNELSQKLKQYDEQFLYYNKTYNISIPSDVLNRYNALVDKYKVYESKLEKLPININGYTDLIKHYYNTIDFYLLLQSSLMPKIEKVVTDANKQAALLTSSSLSPVACQDVSKISLKTADNLVLSMAKVLITGAYRIKVKTSSLSGQTWNGVLSVTNYADETDKADTQNLSVTINDNYEVFVKQKIEKILKKETVGDVSITGLFKLSLVEFKTAIKRYCLDYLSILQNCCQSCIDVLIEQGVGDKESWIDTTPNLYNDLYLKYFEKLNAITEEIKIREDEVIAVAGTYAEDGSVKTYGVQTYIEIEKDKIRNILDFEKFLGEKLWIEFSAFKREDIFSNSNYVSDGLNNGEIIKKAEEFLDIAKKEIYKSAELQHSISTTLNNLLFHKKFEKLLDKFEVGNTIRVEVEDNIYVLKLLSYELDFSDIQGLQVEFSDVISIQNNESRAIKDALKAQSMSSSYDTVKRQANKGDNSNNVINGWIEKGMDITKTNIVLGADNQTQTWDEHGMLFRQYDEILDSYNDEQLKILNSSIVMTNDNWKTVKTAVGKHYYVNPKTKKLESAYGINSEVLVGKLILGEKLGIYSNDNSLSFDSGGLNVTNGKNVFTVNPNDPKGLLKISNSTQNLLYLDEQGMLHLSGDGAGIEIGNNATITKMRMDFEEGFTATVSKKELGNQVNTYLSMTQDVIDMKSGLILWHAKNSSMDANGTLTCDSAIMNNAKISGSVVTDNGDHKVIMSDGRLKIYYHNTYVGMTGANGYKGTTGIYGLNFDLESDGKYMTWASRMKPEDVSYTMKWTYNKDGIVGYAPDSLNAGCAIYMNKYSLISDGTIYFNPDKTSYMYESSSNQDVVLKSKNETVSVYSNINMKGFSIIGQSDERLKENIAVTQKDALSLINQIDVMEYNWRSNKKKVDAGLIAQQLKTIIPEVVDIDSNGIYSIKPLEIIPYLIKAIQQLSEITISQSQRGALGFFSIPNYTYNSYTQTEIDNALRLAAEQPNETIPNIITHD